MLGGLTADEDEFPPYGRNPHPPPLFPVPQHNDPPIHVCPAWENQAADCNENENGFEDGVHVNLGGQNVPHVLLS